MLNHTTFASNIKQFYFFLLEKFETDVFSRFAVKSGLLIMHFSIIDQLLPLCEELVNLENSHRLMQKYRLATLFGFMRYVNFTAALHLINIHSCFGWSKVKVSLDSIYIYSRHSYQCLSDFKPMIELLERVSISKMLLTTHIITIGLGRLIHSVLHIVWSALHVVKR